MLVDNVAALANAMSQVLKNPPEIDKAALAKHLEKYSIEHMIDGYPAAGVEPDHPIIRENLADARR